MYHIHFTGKKEASPPAIDEDVEMKEKENTTPEKHQNDVETDASANDSAPKRRRYKAKKQVKRTYEDEDGYIRT